MPRLLPIATALLASPVAWGHGDSAASHRLLSLDPLVLTLLGAAVLAYGWGVARLWRRHAGRVLRGWQAGSFAAGIGILGLALIWPLDALAERSFAAHMLQHLLLIGLAPPLLVLGAPLAAFAVLGAPGRLLAAAPWNRVVPPIAAFGLHGVVVWAWHAPAPFQWALRSDAVHTLEHATMLGTALLLWWSVLAASRGRAHGPGAGLVWLFLTMTHMGLLGALLTFAPRPLYPAYGETTAFGLSALEDQQLAGLIMWVPGGIIYLVAGLALAAKWLRQAERVAGWKAPPLSSARPGDPD